MSLAKGYTLMIIASLLLYGTERKGAFRTGQLPFRRMSQIGGGTTYMGSGGGMATW